MEADLRTFSVSQYVETSFEFNYSTCNGFNSVNLGVLYMFVKGAQVIL